MENNVYVLTASLLALVGLIMFGIGFVMMRKEKEIQRFATESCEGKVVKYSASDSHAPVVEYLVNDKAYRKALRYTYVSRVSKITGPTQTISKDDLLDTKLRLQQNAFVSVNTLMKDHFPIGMPMRVYYSIHNPRHAFVERYAPSYLGIIFVVGGIFTLLLQLILWFVFKF